MRLLIALAIAASGLPALAQQADQSRRVDDGRDNPRAVEHRRYGEKHNRCPHGVEKQGKGYACRQVPQATRPGDPNPYATRAGDPNPHATRAGDPNPYATKAGMPNPYATKAGAPNPYSTRAGDPNPYGPPPAGTPRR
jgi:hypothetical protein